MLIYDDFEDKEELEQVYSIFPEKRRKRIRELLEEDEIINNKCHDYESCCNSPAITVQKEVG